MRLFVALEVPDDVRGDLDLAVAPLRDDLDRLRWTPPAQWHVTLAFLGHVETGIDQIVDVLAAPARDAPPGIGLELGEPGRFGKRVLWVGVRDEPTGAVAEVGEGTQLALAGAGLPVDEKPVRPHLTLARSRGRRGEPIRPEHVDAVPQVHGAWTASELVLFESVQQGRGRPNLYDPRARIALGR